MSGGLTNSLAQRIGEIIVIIIPESRAYYQLTVADWLFKIKEMLSDERFIFAWCPLFC